MVLLVSNGLVGDLNDELEVFIGLLHKQYQSTVWTLFPVHINGEMCPNCLLALNDMSCLESYIPHKSNLRDLYQKVYIWCFISFSNSQIFILVLASKTQCPYGSVWSV